MGQAHLGMAVECDILDCFQPLHEGPFQAKDVLCPRGHFLFCEFRCFSHARDADHVLGSGPLIIFLDASVDEGHDPGFRPDVERSNAVRAVELVSCKACEIHPHFIDIEGQDPNGCNGIGVKGYTPGPGDSPYFCDRFQCADFIIGVHDCYEDRVVRDGLLHFLWIDESVVVNRKGGYAKTVLHQHSQGSLY
ncbi:MAG: hypothetical protein A4E65_02468 [Syntrophorhabdus sp. PtaU1.Bin153]|nr:MAG: hypothetical protein A4E65_02468 [Syntrophorhabdus sp. PtaU1.Bin153]